jgi:hypothetical protein
MSFDAVYMILSQNDELELFLKSDLFVSPNGITLSDDETTIYMADWAIGIYQIDIISKKHSLLSHPKTIKTYHIDGLYFSGNSLLAVRDKVICRFKFNDKRSSLESCDIFEANTSHLGDPKTGVIVEDEFYFLASTLEIIIMKTSMK